MAGIWEQSSAYFRFHLVKVHGDENEDAVDVRRSEEGLINNRGARLIKQMIDYLTYYYSTDTIPFRSLSDLPDQEALKVMENLYNQYKENILFERFSNPTQYLQNRRQTENWVRSAFIEKGGHPTDPNPISMVLGSSKWIENNPPNSQIHGEIRIPLSLFSPLDISFTFPDSMVSRWLMNDKAVEYFIPEYHGKVFTVAEILSLVSEHGLPEDHWNMNLPNDTGAYIEAQVWNRKLLEDFIKTKA